MRKTNKGFTVIELVISIALLALILVPVAGFFTNSFKIQSKTSMKTSITRVGQYVMENFKNKNYLGLTVDGKAFEEYIQTEGVSGLALNGSNEVNVTGDYGWEFNYNNVDYIINIGLNGLTESDISNLEIPNKDDCNGIAVINSDGSFEGYTDVPTYVTGSTFTNPIDGKSYTADCPTIVLKADTFELGTDDKATLWITNDYGEDGQAWKKFRIIKEFKNELHVYVEGDNVSIIKGQEGDGASAAQTRITSSYVGLAEEGNTERSSSELLLDAKMTISNKNDDTIRDTFTFSFPVDYDYQ